MGWLRGKKDDKPEYTGLQLQTAAAFLPIPIVWGTNKVAHNVIFYDNFQQHKSSSKTGKGGHHGGGGSSSQQFDHLYLRPRARHLRGADQRFWPRMEG